MTEKIPVRLKVNGRYYDAAISADASLSRVLRDELGLMGTKEGCGTGYCGSCTVLIDGSAMKSCLVPAVTVGDREVVTIEGMSSPEHPLHPVQQAFVDAGAIQCGYCTPGFVMSVYALLRMNPKPTDEEIKRGLSGNICRCTGYETILSAVRLASERLSSVRE